MLELIRLRFTVAYRSLVNYLTVIRRYYPNPLFRKIDIYLLRHYLIVSPFQISRQYTDEKGSKEGDVYGETPLTTMEQIAYHCQISSTDTFYELGCGRGRTCFWMNTFIKCQVVGIEIIPTFVKIAREVKQRYHVEGVSFVCENILDVELEGATVLYFYGTCASDPFIYELVRKCEKLKLGTKIITISYPITDYDLNGSFRLVKSFPVIFPWGETEGHLCTISR